MEKISVTLTSAPKAKPKAGDKLPFGSVFTDHMFLMDYSAGRGWHDARIVPYGPLTLDPSAICLHYGQEVFEGMKAYRGDDGRLLLFRPEENYLRLNNSNERMCIPALDVDLCIEATKQLVTLERDWVPTQRDASLYLRPFIIATEAKLGVKQSANYLFVIIASPSGPYYESGLNPVKIYVETKYVRAVRGGIGMAKTGGNYAASLRAQVEAHEQNYSQVLWLDGVERKYIEEVGAMNIFFVIDGVAVTPAVNGSILPGITRKSVIELLKRRGVPVEERRVSIQEIADAHKQGKLEEVFGTGTAAVISPVGVLKWDSEIMTIGDGGIGKLSASLYDELTSIQWGRAKGPEGWSVEIAR